MNVVTAGAREEFLAGTMDWDGDDFRVVLLASTYVYSAAHDFLDDIAGGDRAATSAALTGKTTTDGVADAADVAIGAVAAGPIVTALWIYQHTGVEATSRLVCFMDTQPNGAAISVTPDGGTVNVEWSNDTNRIFKI